jgi:hypothetical protein
MIAAAQQQALESRDTARFAAALLWDLFRSLPRAHWNNPSPGALITALTLYAITFGSLLLFTLVSDHQQHRRVADYMPGELTRQYTDAVTAQTCATYPPGCTVWYAGLLSSRRSVQEISSPSWARTGTAFVAFYDSAGHVLGSDARLNGNLPQPALGIFDTIRQRREARIIWQPQPGVRVALTGRPLRSGGFVLSGDSLANVEAEQRSFIRFHRSECLMLLAAAILSVLSRARARYVRRTAH